MDCRIGTTSLLDLYYIRKYTYQLWVYQNCLFISARIKPVHYITHLHDQIFANVTEPQPAVTIPVSSRSPS